MKNIGIKRKFLFGAAVVCMMGNAGNSFAQENIDLSAPPPLQSEDDGLGEITNIEPPPAEDESIQNLLPEENVDVVPDNIVLEAPGAAQLDANVNNAGMSPPDSGAANPADAQMPDPNDDVFYDAEAFVPEGQLARQSPRKADPRTEPASRMIIVNKNASAGSRQAKLVSAERALKLGRESSALEIYNDLYKQNRRDTQVLMGRAIALQKLGLEEEAVMAYEELLSVEPGNVDARANMLGLMSSKYPAVALRQLKDLRTNNPDNVALVAQLAIAEAQIGNLDSAIRYMGVAASMEPNNANHYFNLAIMADRAGAKSEAIQYYERALEVDSVYGGSRSIPRDSIYERLAKLR